MVYKVLYRKYRPNSFKEIVGQDIIVKTLQNSVENNNFSHAYIFTGPRGTGKTSTAKVLAKSINCENQVKGEACGTCNSCKNFNTSPDIIEIDAASNNGVDEIRELRNNISLAPSEAKYKIYIIDEVHMLSTSAFNALLKTLEEPPAHAIFILATTEVYKVPITILSRCQRFDFLKINKKDMVNHLKNICEAEEIKYDDKALEEIYELSEGCVRDSLSILDQSTKDNKKLEYEKLLNDYNIVSSNSIKVLIDSIFEKNVNTVIKTLNDFQNSGINAQRLIKKIINYLENLMIDNIINKNEDTNFEILKRLILELDNIYTNSRFDDNVYTIIKLIFISINNNIQMEEKKTINKDKKIEDKSKSLEFRDTRINNTFVGASKDYLKELINKWKNIEIDSIENVDLKQLTPVVASSIYAIICTNDDEIVEIFNNKYFLFEEELKKNGIKHKLVAVSSNQWNEIKKEYIKKLSSGYKYKIIKEKNENYDNLVENIFKNQKIEIIS